MAKSVKPKKEKPEVPEDGTEQTAPQPEEIELEDASETLPDEEIADKTETEWDEKVSPNPHDQQINERI